MTAPLKKGSLIRVVPERLADSLEARASDRRFPPYLFETAGEILDIQADYALVRFRVPTPNVWLRLDQLKPSAS